MTLSARQIALNALLKLDFAEGVYISEVLDRQLKQSPLRHQERGLATELVYGVTRQKLLLDHLIEQATNRIVEQQSPVLLNILRLGLYQLRFLSHIPVQAVVHSAVELAKENKLQHLSTVVNGVLRNYLRERDEQQQPGSVDIPALPEDPKAKLSILHSFPLWIVDLWWQQLGPERCSNLLRWFNRTPHLDVRVNALRAERSQVQQTLAGVGIRSQALEGLPQGLRLLDSPGAIEALPGYGEGYWSIQDGAAQWAVMALAPQPGELILDLCAAPGGKTTYIAEQMGNQGSIYAFDKHRSRLRRLAENIERLGITTVFVQPAVDILTHIAINIIQADRILVDAPCSGLGTLHRHPDARWRRHPQQLPQTAELQSQILEKATTWIKPGGLVVYSTCTLNFQENEQVVADFLKIHPDWQLEPMEEGPFQGQGQCTIWPHEWDLDGFYIARLRAPH
jgi:16S rRNA (cytosine967-C5)-methyltransferase